jgi:hypothetical protein
MLLGQFGDGELLQDAQDGARASPAIRIAFTGKARYRQLDGRVFQFDAPAFVGRLSIASRLRTQLTSCLALVYVKSIQGQLIALRSQCEQPHSVEDCGILQNLNEASDKHECACHDAQTEATNR